MTANDREEEEATPSTHPGEDGDKPSESAEPGPESVEPLVHHPLQYPWVLWYDSPGKRVNQASWFDNMKRVAEFATVEDFWGFATRPFLSRPFFE